jgi:hypothetical protein
MFIRPHRVLQLQLQIFLKPHNSQLKAAVKATGNSLGGIVCGANMTGGVLTAALRISCEAIPGPPAQ